jgi:hypothetical protein
MTRFLVWVLVSTNNVCTQPTTIIRHLLLSISL